MGHGQIQHLDAVVIVQDNTGGGQRGLVIVIIALRLECTGNLYGGGVCHLNAHSTGDRRPSKPVLSVNQDFIHTLTTSSEDLQSEAVNEAIVGVGHGLGAQGTF